MEQLEAMSRFVARRSGPRLQDYVGAPRETLMVDHRRFMRDGRDARKMLEYLRFCEDMSAVFSEQEVMHRCIDAVRSVRLTWDGKAWRFVACQHEPVEYRAAACSWLAAVIAEFWGISHGRRDVILERARKAFGCGVARRWFR